MSFLVKLIVVFLGINFSISSQCFAANLNEPMQSYSQASQDRFVRCLLYDLLGKQDDGFYLEIGAGHPSIGNNSYAFEKNFGWKGVSIDISDGHKNIWHSTRQNVLLIEDATQSDYSSILQSFPEVIDYLSLDIDCCYNAVLQRIPFTDYTFKVITIEHDSYRLGDRYRQDERAILESLGYYLLCPDVSIFFNGKDSIFEDWWIHPGAFPEDLFRKLTSLDLQAKNHDELINIIQNCQNLVN